MKDKVKGFAILNHAPDLKFTYLDFISVAPDVARGGIGSVLYERAREEAISLNSIGIFMECLPDEPALCKDPVILKENKDRLRFYERFNVFPIINTKYETPLKEGDDCPPYLVYDNLENKSLPNKKTIQKIVKAILNRKYEETCPDSYVKMVVESFKDNIICLRPPRYQVKGIEIKLPIISSDHRIALVKSEKHEIHHINQKGYVESPIRIKSILKGLENLNIFDKYDAKEFSEKHIKEVHNPKFFDYLKKVCSNLGKKESIYPYIFPIRNQTRPPKELAIRAGYYCIDTFTPLNKNAYLAAKAAVDCTLTAAEKILDGYRFCYSLVRPPGHHAERNAFGGFCYFNSAAIAANFLSKHGKVAVLDIDYHHGNGTQDIFYKRGDVYTLSIHGAPNFAYPYFSGFKEETGHGEGLGFNHNIPLPEHCSPTQYQLALKSAINLIKKFNPKFVVISLGFDTAKNDPTGSWEQTPEDFKNNAKLLAGLNLPLLIVQEGGYKSKSLPGLAKNFFHGLVSN